ncbi:MAG: hypothetical protein Q8R98_10855, partial [Rubrivivax sp.]|nr:hypothetical protein [Rubrivivax sp.]
MSARRTYCVINDRGRRGSQLRQADGLAFRVTYRPWPAFQSEFQADVDLALGSGSATPGNLGVRGLDIVSFTVWNDFEFSFSNPDDQLMILARGEIAGVKQDVTMTFRSVDIAALSGTGLVDELNGPSPGLFAPINGAAVFPRAIAFGTGAFFTTVKSVSDPIARVPVPGTAALAPLGLGLLGESAQRSPADDPERQIRRLAATTRGADACPLRRTTRPALGPAPARESAGLQESGSTSTGRPV